MKLEVTLPHRNPHTDTVTACCWSPSGDLVTFSDDKTMQLWVGGEPDEVRQVRELPFYVTAAAWMPRSASRPSETIAVGASDGTMRFLDSSGREEKRVVVSERGAAVTCVCWSCDASALATSSEDGSVKVWSRAGMLRSTLVASGAPVFTVSWGPDGDRLLWASGSSLCVRSTTGRSAKAHSWVAHEGGVLCSDWSATHGLIVSGGEDRRYRVYDAFGRPLFASSPLRHAITSVRWAPGGETFAVGAHGVLRLCARAGWSHTREHPADAGSLLHIAWADDSTRLAGAGAAGTPVLANVVGRTAQGGGYSALQVNPTTVRVTVPAAATPGGSAAAAGGGRAPLGAAEDDDALVSTSETLEFRAPVAHLAIGNGHLVAATVTQLHIFALGEWTTPHILDLTAPPTLLILGPKNLCIVDLAEGIRVVGYDARAIAAPRATGLDTKGLDAATVSLGPDSIAILDRRDAKTVRVFETRSGRAVGSAYVHPTEVRQVRLSQHGSGLPRRRLALVDASGDLYVTPVTQHEPEKLATMCESCAWNDASDALLAAADGRSVLWMDPSSVWVDRDLCALAKVETDASDWGRLPTLISFIGSRATVQRGDGAILHTTINPFLPLLASFVTSQQWEPAVRLCRYVKQKALWAALAAQALEAAHLDTAEVALAAVGALDKLAFVLHLRDIRRAEHRSSEMALYRRLPDDAERILLQASPPLHYHAVKLNIRLLRWERALEIAKRAEPKLVEVLCHYRARYLKQAQTEEHIDALREAAAAHPVDPDRVQRTKEEMRAAEDG